MAAKIVLISNDEILFRKLQFALQHVQMDCIAVRSEKDLDALKQRGPVAAYFFDSASGYRAAADLAWLLRKDNDGGTPPLMVILTYNRLMKDLRGENAIFDEFCLLPFLRQDIYKILKKNRLLKQEDLRPTPILHAISDESIDAFLNEIQSSQTVITPVFDNSYYYPDTDPFFPGDARDNISLLLQLAEQGRLQRKVFDRVHQCPVCASSLVNFRECCPQCHGLDFSPVEMLHHFACGYVGSSAEFIRSGSDELTCPKCAKTLRHIGMDYEKPISSFLCGDCGMNFAIAAVRCRCFPCGAEFSPGEANLLTFYTYTVSGNTRRTGRAQQPEQAQDLYSVSKETFVCILRQNIGISRELGFNIQLVSIDGSALRDAERNELLQLLHEFKRPVDVLYLSAHGIILVLIFYLSQEALLQKIEQFKVFYQKRASLSKRELFIQAHHFTSTDSLNAGMIVDRLGEAFSREESI